MISSSLFIKWKRMIKGDSIFHVNQTEGQCYSTTEVKGYYNNLTDKVRYTKILDDNGIPVNYASQGEIKKLIYFPITIFQYGLGAYDLWLMENKTYYLDKAIIMADWALTNQADNGSWDAFGPLNYHCRYSSMAQGEGASLLARAYIATNDTKYLNACKKAIDFMLLSLEEGGTSFLDGDCLKLYEYPEKSLVLNGWIFSSFGIYDFWKISDDSKYKDAWDKSITGIITNLEYFDSGHWSLYDGDKYTSPFYHKLHIELLKACNNLSPHVKFNMYIDKWSNCLDNKFWSALAFLIKAKQKLFEKKNQEWILVE